MTLSIIQAERQEYERVKREVARLVSTLQTMPVGLVNLVNINQLIKGLNLDLSYSTVLNIVKDFRKGLEGKESMAGKDKQPQGADNQIVLEQIAAIQTKTFAYCGDGESIAAEDANLLTIRLLKKLDPSLLTRNEKRRPPKVPPRY